MPELVAPAMAVHRSYVEAMEEFRLEGRDCPGDDGGIGRKTGADAADWADPDVFARFVWSLRLQSVETTPRPDGFVPSTALWWVEEKEFLGALSIRHRLTPWLLDVGGHIGYDVRPSARRRGHGTAMLRAALPVAAGLGIERALVTCDEDNEGSRRIIEKNGGVLEDRRGVKLRYWVPTAP
ncbi:GNAT family N-acetyltransferase [Actinomadura graeca]|uniref:GNAT family N-acetyltransferase n=1 Tax=Actinomadura graeca TaxID=2750812 RepID=A0ABX8R0V8_9ACTN|nr:GNAT family N-acetyltransferase [Actinomadura graeca]QXJ24690.1 GNAT family N-acetyltransferase [Actinomadura graeca]